MGGWKIFSWYKKNEELSCNLCHLSNFMANMVHDTAQRKPTFIYDTDLMAEFHFGNIGLHNSWDNFSSFQSESSPHNAVLFVFLHACTNM